jgi:hypothetical protein
LGRGTWAEIEPLLMMRPPRGSCAFMTRYAACAHRNAPVRFVSTTAFQSSTASSSSGAEGPNVPALLKSTSSRSSPENSASTAAGSVTSAAATVARS